MLCVLVCPNTLFYKKKQLFRLTQHWQCDTICLLDFIPLKIRDNMKKTLITLAALAASAVTVSAAGLEEVDFSYNESDFDNGHLDLQPTLMLNGSSEWTMEFNVQLGTGSYDADGRTVLFEVGSGDDFGSGKGFMAYVMNAGDDTYTLTYAFRTDISDEDKPAGNKTYEKVTFSDDYTLKAGDVLMFTFKNVPSAQEFLMDVQALDLGNVNVESGHSYTRPAPTSNLNTFASVDTAIGRDGGTGSMSGWKVAGLNGTASIPEPTTATLSLLALAGLAARRRRK